MAKGEKFSAHSNYGTGYEGNYIEAHIHGNVYLFRDIKHVHLYMKESSYSTPCKMATFFIFQSS